MRLRILFGLAGASLGLVGPSLANAQVSATAGPPACGRRCGTERWAVKTLTDTDTGEIVPVAVLTTVAALRGIPRPPPRALPETQRVLNRDPAAQRMWAATERTIYLLHVMVVGWKAEADSDYHLVIADSGALTRTMIVEAPNPRCARACASAWAPAFAAVRASIRGILGLPPVRFRRLRRPVPVTLAGVGFFDVLHGQTGVAPNGLELHPLLTIVQEGP